MIRITLRTVVASAMMFTVALTTAQAQEQAIRGDTPALFSGGGESVQSIANPTYPPGTVLVPSRTNKPARSEPVRYLQSQPRQLASRNAPAAPARQATPGYPYLNAALYASPRPDIPYQMGGAIITNQAFAPHEMLYSHDYRAMYPPFYYRVRGGWVVTPHGVRSHETWELQGTEVRVKYRSRVPLLSGFLPPRR